MALRKERRHGLLLFSGGIDSTISAIILNARVTKLTALTVNYLGRPEGEIRAAKLIARKLRFHEHIEVTLNTSGLLTKFPDGKGVRRGWIPYRNLLFWSIAAHKALMLNVQFVAAGHTRKDGIAFSDASPQFFTRLQHLFRFTGSDDGYGGIEIELPIYRTSETEQRRIASEHWSIIRNTWSCWLGSCRPCMTCYACQDRRRFFKKV